MIFEGAAFSLKPFNECTHRVLVEVHIGSLNVHTITFYTTTSNVNRITNFTYVNLRKKYDDVRKVDVVHISTKADYEGDLEIIGEVFLKNKVN